jgi:hypothetical protein
MDAIFNNLESLIFIAIVAIAIINSILKKKPGAEDTNGGGDSDDVPSSPSQSAPRPATQPRTPPVSIDEEMRRTLEDIFSSKQPPPQESRRTAYESQKQTSSYDSRKNVSVHTRSNAQPQAGKKLSRSTGVDAEWERTLRERQAKEIARAAAKAEAAAAVTSDMFIPVDEQALLAQARNGVIWSEILQPPVSMR